MSQERDGCYAFYVMLTFYAREKAMNRERQRQSSGVIYNDTRAHCCPLMSARCLRAKSRRDAITRDCER